MFRSVIIYPLGSEGLQTLRNLGNQVKAVTLLAGRKDRVQGSQNAS